MLSRIQVVNYACFPFVNRILDRFHVLSGPDASGKTIFSDTHAFLGDLLIHTLDHAPISISRERHFDPSRHQVTVLKSSAWRQVEWVSETFALRPETTGKRFTEDLQRRLFPALLSGCSILSGHTSLII